MPAAPDRTAMKLIKAPRRVEEIPSMRRLLGAIESYRRERDRKALAALEDEIWFATVAIELER
jgi:hypothetical protein